MSREPEPRRRDTVAALDEHGHRLAIYPAEVRGKYTRLRMWLHGGLILFYLLLPWVRIKGMPAVLLDVSERRFVLLGTQFWAFDAPLLFFILALVVFGLFFATALWGRVWCGYACPQTVFVEAMFRRLEGWIEGPAAVRRRRDAEREGSADWMIRKLVKWPLFAALSVAIALSFLAYFIGSEGVMRVIQHPTSVSSKLGGVLAVVSAIILVDFGYLREQFCIIACPYGRFQSVLMDRHSPILAYEPGRGEPRGKGDGAGDCIDCNRCVQVCPTGIDIRNGLQMECIACAACADACDEVMDKLKRPRGLVGYSTEAERSGQPRRPLRTRTLVYGSVLGVLTLGLTGALLTRSDLDILSLRGLEAPYQEVKGAQGDLVINHLRFDLTNLVPRPRTIRMGLPRELSAQGFAVVTATNPVALAPAKMARTDVFITFPKSALVRGKVKGTMEFLEGDRVVERRELTLVGPFN
jgi:cytochrome c oxidase accessory protein FixG